MQLIWITRAWDFTKPVVVAPAMNTCMWEHPVTSVQVRVPVYGSELQKAFR